VQDVDVIGLNSNLKRNANCNDQDIPDLSRFKLIIGNQSTLKGLIFSRKLGLVKLTVWKMNFH